MSSTERSDSSYLSNARLWELSKTAALCGSSVATIIKIGALSTPIPPVSAVLIGGAAIGLAGCVAYSVAFLEASDDTRIREISDAKSLTGPGLFLAPIGAVIRGEKGMYFAAAAGDVAVSGLQFYQSVSEHGASFMLGMDPDKFQLYDDAYRLYGLATQPDFDKSYYDADSDAFEPHQGYDLDTLEPPGMGDVEPPRETELG